MDSCDADRNGSAVGLELERIKELRTLLCDLAADDVAVRKRIYEELGGQ